MIKKILVAIDGSRSAEKALEFALDLAYICSAKVLLLSVVHHNHMLYGMCATEAMVNLKEELINYHEKMLSDSLKKAKEIKSNLEISTKLIVGYPSDSIVNIAENEKVDIIIMGSRGLSKIKRIFLGSVSNGVVNHATRPVLIVK